MRSRQPGNKSHQVRLQVELPQECCFLQERLAPPDSLGETESKTTVGSNQYLSLETPSSRASILVGVSPEADPETKIPGQIIYLEGQRHTNREEESEPGKAGQLKSSKLSRPYCGQLGVIPISVEHCPRVILFERLGNWGSPTTPPVRCVMWGWRRGREA